MAIPLNPLESYGQKYRLLLPIPPNFDSIQKARHNPGAIYSPMTQDTQIFSTYQARKKDRFCITMRFALIIEFLKIPTKMSATSLSIEVDVTELGTNRS